MAVEVLSASPVPDDALFRIFLRLADRWHLSASESATLLAVATRTLFRWKRDPSRARLSVDQRERVSYLVNIYLDLNDVFDTEESANEWIRRPNVRYAGTPPLDVMLDGSYRSIARVFDQVREALW